MMVSNEQQGDKGVNKMWVRSQTSREGNQKPPARVNNKNFLIKSIMCCIDDEKRDSEA
jgi:hypothetical protein